MQKKKQGISLIVLIITIIVMIILAATIIITLNNNGIIDKASEAVDKTNEKQVEELVNLAWADAYADNVGKSGTELQTKLQEAVEKALTDNNLDKEDYGMKVTTTGVTIVKGWLQTENGEIIKGDTRLNIGDKVNYNPKAGLSDSDIAKYTYTSLKTKNGKENVTYNLSSMYDGEWYVIGVNDNRELLILSYGSIGNIAFYGWAGFNNGVGELDTICSLLSHGKGANSARSIKKEDFEKLVGKNVSDYTWFAYDSTNLEGYGDNGFIVSQDMFNILSGENHPGYYVANLFGNDSTERGIMRVTQNSQTRFAINGAFEDNLLGCYSSTCTEGEQNSRSIRAIVELSTDITLTGSSTSGWSIE